MQVADETSISDLIDGPIQDGSARGEGAPDGELLEEESIDGLIQPTDLPPGKEQPPARVAGRKSAGYSSFATKLPLSESSPAMEPSRSESFVQRTLRDAPEEPLPLLSAGDMDFLGVKSLKVTAVAPLVPAKLTLRANPDKINWLEDARGYGPYYSNSEPTPELMQEYADALEEGTACLIHVPGYGSRLEEHVHFALSAAKQTKGLVRLPRLGRLDRGVIRSGFVWTNWVYSYESQPRIVLFEVSLTESPPKPIVVHYLDLRELF